MKQYEAVIKALEQHEGIATLAQLYKDTLRIPGVVWKTKTPHASIRRIVQQRPEIFKVRPGLWALESFRKQLDLEPEDKDSENYKESVEKGHSYYQGLVAIIGKLRGYSTYIPNQDKNKMCVHESLGEIRTLNKLPSFSYYNITKRASTIDVSWFNDRDMPHSFFEIEHSTNFQNSLLKFHDLQDFNARMIIVASSVRQREFKSKINYLAFREIANRVNFYDYERLVRVYEKETINSDAEFIL